MNRRLFEQCFLSTEEVGRKTKTDMTLVSPACCRPGIDPEHLANNEPRSFCVIRGVKSPNGSVGGCMRM